MFIFWRRGGWGCKCKFTPTVYVSPCGNPENQDTEPSNFLNKTVDVA